MSSAKTTVNMTSSASKTKRTTRYSNHLINKIMLTRSSRKLKMESMK